MTLFVLMAGGLLVLLLAGMFGLWRAGGLAGGIRAVLEAVPEGRADPPGDVRAWAQRMGARGDGGSRLVRLEQEAEIELNPGAGWQAITARQVIALGAPGFLWEVRLGGLGPMPKALVIDSFAAGHGLLAVRILGAIPVVTARGEEIDRAEAMRYLAELAWAPDAALHNPALRWEPVPGGFAVALEGGAAVTLELDAAGDIVTMRAQARPATAPDGTPTAYDWEGHFSDYGLMGGRRIPRRGEVGYIREGQYVPYWRGRITSYSVE